MSEMVERVAKALLATPGHSYETMARAAIEAMREPTLQMWGHGAHALKGRSALTDAYRAMIDAALGEET